MTQVVEFQDDVYVVVKLEDLDEVYRCCDQFWGELGLAFNRSKIKIFTASDEVAAALPEHWKSKRVANLKMLGQRLSMRLDEEGLPLFLGGSENLDVAEGQLRQLMDRLSELSSHGLPAAVRHQLWLYASAGAVTHLLACCNYKPAELAKLDALQTEHLKWIAQRDVDIDSVKLAGLPASKGGIGLPIYSKSGPAIFLAAKSRLLPAYAPLLSHASGVQLLEEDVELKRHITEAWATLLKAGCFSRHMPFSQEVPTAKKTTKGMIALQNRKIVEE